MQFDEYETTACRHSPLPGEHTEEVHAELGYDAGRIATLEEEGVL